MTSNGWWGIKRVRKKLGGGGAEERQSELGMRVWANNVQHAPAPYLFPENEWRTQQRHLQLLIDRKTGIFAAHHDSNMVIFGINLLQKSLKISSAC